MKAKYTLLILSTLFLFNACEYAYFNPKPETDNLSIFEEYSKIVNEKYALAEVKGVDLVALQDSIRPFITDDLTQEELYDYMYLITKRMKEGHTNLNAPQIDKVSFAAHDWTAGYPKAYDTKMAAYYYDEDFNPDVKELNVEGGFFPWYYGVLPDHPDIGFIVISSFGVEFANEDLEIILEELKDTKGMVIDVRSNLGGFVELAARLTSYFTTEEYVFATNKVKNGPGLNDYADSELNIIPSGSPLTYTKPVMLLQGRVTFSSGSLFSIMMSYNDHVQTVGQSFGGGTGEIVEGLLANGWEYIISTSNLVDWKGRPTDDGYEPDIPVLLDLQDTLKDEFIERAILEINNN